MNLDARAAAGSIFIGVVALGVIAIIHPIHSDSDSPPYPVYPYESQNAVVNALNDYSKFSGWQEARFYWRPDHILTGAELVMEGSELCFPDFLQLIPPEPRELIVHGGFTRFECHFRNEHLQLLGPTQEATKP
jgi:hypothetical protein